MFTFILYKKIKTYLTKESNLLFPPMTTYDKINSKQ
jgi:hypothetical protein